MLARLRRGVWPYVLALAIVGAVTALKLALPLVGREVPFLLFGVAVLAAGWFGGGRAALAATILACCSLLYFFLPHFGAFGLRDPETAARLGVFFAEGLVVTAIVRALHAAREDVEEHAAKAERAEGELRTTLESIGDAVIATDAQGRITFMNRVAEQLTGWTAQEAALQPFDEVFKAKSEKTGERTASPWARVAREGAVVIGAGAPTLLLAKGGKTFPIDGSCAPIRGPHGRINGVVAVFRDATRRRRNEAELARLLEAETAARADAQSAARRLARLQDVTSALAVARTPREVADAVVHHGVEALGARSGVIACISDDGRSLEVLASRGIAPDVVEGLRKFPVDANYPTAVAFREARPEFVETEEELASRYHELAVSMKERYGACAALPLVVEKNVLGAMTFRFSDNRHFEDAERRLMQAIAEQAAQAFDRARLFKRAQDAVRLRDDFLSIASHELNTPLTPLKLQLAMLRRAKAGPAAAEKNAHRLELAERQVDRIAKLVSELLDVSRITAGRLELSPESLDLAALVRDVAARQAELATRAGSPIHVEGPEALRGWFDRLRTEQVLVNLLTNAVKYGAAKPIDVTLELVVAHASPPLARISVKDRGIGIDAEKQARIFDRFERAVSSRHYGGFGLGLWIARQIVEAAGGSIRVESKVGEGSTFVVELPVREADSRPAAARAI